MYRPLMCQATIPLSNFDLKPLADGLKKVCEKIKEIVLCIFRRITDFFTISLVKKIQISTEVCKALGYLIYLIFNQLFHTDKQTYDIELDDLTKDPDKTGPDYYFHGYGVDGQKPTQFEVGSVDTGEVELTAINGIQVDLDWAKSHANHLSTILNNRKITFIHNPTLGLCKDLYRYAIEAFSKKITPSTDELLKVWIKKINEGKRIVHIPHSEGCAITKVALGRLTSEYRDKIRVIAIAPGSFIPNKFCNKVTHLVSWLDFIPYLDHIGREKYRNSIELLTPDFATLLDHFIYSKTYEKRIQELVDEYLRPE